MKSLKFKMLVLATGEEFKNGIIEEFTDDEKERWSDWLPDSMKIVRIGNQRIFINTDYLLSLEPEIVTDVYKKMKLTNCS